METVMRIGGRAGLALATLLTGFATPLWAQGGEGTTPLFTVNLGTTVWTAIVFLALLGILWKFAWGPILGVVEAREAAIQSAIDEAVRRNAEAAALMEQHRQQIADARRQANDLIAEGRAAADQLRKEIEGKARDEAQAMVERARTEIQRERDLALDALRKESVDLALAAASRLVHQKMDAAQDRVLVERFLGELQQIGSAEA